MGDAAAAAAPEETRSEKRPPEEATATATTNGVSHAAKKRWGCSELGCKCVIVVPYQTRRASCPECHVEWYTNIKQTGQLHCLTFGCSGKPEWCDYRPQDDESSGSSEKSEDDHSEDNCDDYELPTTTKKKEQPDKIVEVVVII